MDRQHKHRLIFTGLNLVLIAAMVYLANRFYTTNAPKQVSYSEFLSELQKGDLTEVQVTERDLIGVLKSDSSHPPGRQATIRATRLPGVDSRSF